MSVATVLMRALSAIWKGADAVVTLGHTQNRRWWWFPLLQCIFRRGNRRVWLNDFDEFPYPGKGVDTIRRFHTPAGLPVGLAKSRTDGNEVMVTFRGAVGRAALCATVCSPVPFGVMS